ncbi:MAG TPA: hypothetical protein VGO60_05095 [Iamia sp.]|jgi:hypothetical protein|nr:hypothetical protein [Iamia sp.]
MTVAVLMLGGCWPPTGSAHYPTMWGISSDVFDGGTTVFVSPSADCYVRAGKLSHGRTVTLRFYDAGDCSKFKQWKVTGVRCIYDLGVSLNKAGATCPTSYQGRAFYNLYQAWTDGPTH